MNDQLRDIDRVLKLVNREIWIVTAQSNEGRAGLTATWVSQASIDSEEPMIVIGLAPNHHTATVVEQSGAFAVHLLQGDQSELAFRFGANSSRDVDKFAGLEITSGPCGSPILNHCLAWLDCRLLARYDGGDRIYYWGQPQQGETWGSGGPLREQEFVGALNNEQLLDLISGREADIQLQRPLRKAWLDR